MELEAAIKASITEAIKALYHKDISIWSIAVQKTSKGFKGDLTVVVFPLLKFSGKPPEKTGKDFGEYLKSHLKEVVDYSVIQGFLNLEINESYWSNFMLKIRRDDSYGYARLETDKTIMVEYSQPNTNKPLHLGHLRNNMLGYSLSKILKANGHNVIMANIINDRGIHICKSMLAWQKWGNGETPESTGMKGDKLVGKYYVEFNLHYKKQIKALIEDGMSEAEASKNAGLILEAQKLLQDWEKGDQEVIKLWREMNYWVLAGFDVTYKKMGISFDKVYYESETYLLGVAAILKGLESGFFYREEDGSVWCDLSDYSLEPKLLLRADGTSVYMTQDIGTAIQRFEEFPLNKLIYVVGDEQIHHFKVLFAILKKMGYEWADSCFHLSYGMVELPSGKMKSREGTVVDADDIMAEMTTTAKKLSEELGKTDELNDSEKEQLYELIGLGALKYFLVKVDPGKKMLFNPEESIDFNGHTGPFIQYAYTRIQSLLGKADKELLESTGHTNYNPGPKEMDLIKQLHDFPGIVKEAGNSLSPALLANYIYELAREFNNFYQTVPVLKDNDSHAVSFRLCLSEVTGKVINTGMDLLGIELPLRM